MVVHAVGRWERGHTRRGRELGIASHVTRDAHPRHRRDPISALQCGAAIVRRCNTRCMCAANIVYDARNGYTARPPRNSATYAPPNIIYYYGRLFGAGRAVRLAVHIRVLQVLPGQSARRRAGRVPLRQRHQARAPARGVRRVRRVRWRPAAVRLKPRQPGTRCLDHTQHRFFYTNGNGALTSKCVRGYCDGPAHKHAYGYSVQREQAAARRKSVPRATPCQSATGLDDRVSSRGHAQNRRFILLDCRVQYILNRYDHRRNFNF